MKFGFLNLEFGVGTDAGGVNAEATRIETVNMI
jgi:hypothetical protein